MLFTYPSFIGVKEQTESELLFNSVRMAIQTHAGEIWVDLDFGTTIRNLIKQGIDNIVLSEIQNEIEIKLDTYFRDELEIDSINVWQELDKVKVELNCIELRTGIHYTVQSEEIIINPDQTLH